MTHAATRRSTHRLAPRHGEAATKRRRLDLTQRRARSRRRIATYMRGVRPARSVIAVVWPQGLPSDEQPKVDLLVAGRKFSAWQWLAMFLYFGKSLFGDKVLLVAKGYSVSPCAAEKDSWENSAVRCVARHDGDDSEAFVRR
jgi:hypothetical protein